MPRKRRAELSGGCVFPTVGNFGVRRSGPARDAVSSAARFSAGPHRRASGASETSSAN